MSAAAAPPNPPPSEEVNIRVGREVVVPTQPAEVAYPLRQEEFAMLCEGEAATKDERWRDVAISASLSALVGLIGLLATVDWASKKWSGFVFVVLLATIFLAAGVIGLFLRQRARQQAASSGCASLKNKIREFFESHSGKL
jgi:hypothetical protein